MLATSPQRDLLDTNIVLHLIRGSRIAEVVIARYGFDADTRQPLISIVTVGEINSLARRLQWGRQKIKKLDELLAGSIIVPLEFPGLIDAYARIDAHTRSVGRPIGENDCWIAATAVATGSRLITTDSDFDGLDPAFLSRVWIDPNSAR